MDYIPMFAESSMMRLLVVIFKVASFHAAEVNTENADVPGCASKEPQQLRRNHFHPKHVKTGH